MHLWPSMTIRDSFKLSYLKKLEWNLQRMNSEKKQQQQQQSPSGSNDQQQNLLVDNPNNGSDEVSGPFLNTSSSKNKFSVAASVCREIFMVLSCCYCCFCCGACTDEEYS